jgi:hypothetical protein
MPVRLLAMADPQVPARARDLPAALWRAVDRVAGRERRARPAT